MPKTAIAPALVTCDDALKSFPVGFHFLNAPPQDKSRVLNVIGQLVGQEFLPGASALDVAETDKFVSSTKSQQIDVRRIRHEFEQLLAAREYHAEHHQAAEHNVVELKKKADALAIELASVQARYGESERLWQNAQAIVERVRQAEKVLETRCEVLYPALSHWTDSR